MYIYGRQPVLEALRSGSRVQKVWLAKNTSGKVIAEIKKRARELVIPVETVEKNNLQKYVGAVVHQGVAADTQINAVLSERQWHDCLKRPNTLIVILDQIQDAHNLGAILRTADAVGVNAVVLPQKGTAQLNATVAKTSAGALFHCSLYQSDRIETVLQQCRDNKLTTIATSLGAGSTIYDTDFRRGLALVIGSEGSGVRKNIAGVCDVRATIPQLGRVNSLNVSVATAVILYEILRQRME